MANTTDGHLTIRGVIYDLDGTLVDSRLDFDAMRCEMRLPPGTPILESLERIEAADPERGALCRAILQRHEQQGAERAAPLPGVPETLLAVRRQGLPQAIVTRNSRAVTERAMARLPDLFDRTVTREDGPVKPDPWAIQDICRSWRTPTNQVVIVGDFRFDIEAGRNAGARTVLLLHGREPSALGGELADLLLPSLADPSGLLNWLFGSSDALHASFRGRACRPGSAD